MSKMLFKFIQDSKVRKDRIANFENILEKLTFKKMTEPKIAWLCQHLFGVNRKLQISRSNLIRYSDKATCPYHQSFPSKRLFLHV